MDLNALILNCTLKKSPEPSNTQGLIDMVTAHFDELGVGHETLRPVDFEIPFGVVSDMGEGDEWPQILEKVLAADILIIGMSIWFGVRNSVSPDGDRAPRRDLQHDQRGRPVPALQHGRRRGRDRQRGRRPRLRRDHPLQPHPPRLRDPAERRHLLGRRRRPRPLLPRRGRQGPPYTQKTAKWMAHNVTHLARILKQHPIPPEGNTVPGWQPEDCSGHDDRMPGGHVG